MREIYVLHVLSGTEFAVKEKLRQEGLVDIYIPMEERLERSRGTWGIRKRLLMPGYVFIQMDLTTKAYYKAWNCPGVIKFLGSDKPSALEPPEKEQLFWLCGEDGLLKSSIIRDKPKGQLEVLEGPLVGHEKEIVKIDRHRRKARVRLSFSGEPFEISVSAHFV